MLQTHRTGDNCPKCKAAMVYETDGGAPVSPTFCPGCLVGMDEAEWCPTCRDFYETTEDGAACPSCVARKDADVASDRLCRDGLLRAVGAAA